MSTEEYWDECIASAFDEAGIVATHEQIQLVSGAVQVSHENYGMACGYDAIPNPLHGEVVRLRKELVAEKSKRVCQECGGRGYSVSHGPSHSATMTCNNCNGQGSIGPKDKP